MKSTGIIRKMDTLGRFVVPKELRASLGLHPGDGVEFYRDGESIIIKKAGTVCRMCGSVQNLMNYKDQTICERCAEGISRMYSEEQ